MKSVMLTLFSALMIVCLVTAIETDKDAYDLDYKMIADLMEAFRKLDKRGAICRDRFMDIMSLKNSNYCRRRRREAFDQE